MANVLPPPPINDHPGSFVWLEWYRQLRNYISQSGSVPWSVIDFSGSNLADIAIRNHNNLQVIQGGTVGQYYHLTSEDYNNVTRTNLVTSVAVDTSLGDAYGTVLVTATGKTITLPAASTARIGRTWTVAFHSSGMLTINTAGGDTVVTSDSLVDTSVVIHTQGTSLTFLCTSATTWSII